jgi:hypothetical protein
MCTQRYNFAGYLSRKKKSFGHMHSHIPRHHMRLTLYGLQQCTYVRTYVCVYVCLCVVMYIAQSIQLTYVYLRCPCALTEETVSLRVRSLASFVSGVDSTFTRVPTPHSYKIFSVASTTDVLQQSRSRIESGRGIRTGRTNTTDGKELQKIKVWK